MLSLVDSNFYYVSLWILALPQYKKLKQFSFVFRNNFCCKSLSFINFYPFNLSNSWHIRDIVINRHLQLILYFDACCSLQEMANEPSAQVEHQQAREGVHVDAGVRARRRAHGQTDHRDPGGHQGRYMCTQLQRSGLYT